MTSIQENDIPKFPSGLRVVETRTDADPIELAGVIKELGIISEYFDTAMFVMGGAGNWSDPHKVASMISGALVIVGKERQLLIGDGGSDSGIMQISGQARVNLVNEGYNCLLLGVAPKDHVRYPGWDGLSGEGIEVFQPEPNHTHIVAVKSLEVGQWGSWGNETNVMYRLFARLAKGKESVGLVVNGGKITLNEVIKNLEQGRNLVVLKGSGRAADAIASIVEGKVVVDQETKELRSKLLREYRDEVARYQGQLIVFDISAEGASSDSMAKTLISNLTLGS